MCQPRKLHLHLRTRTLERDERSRAYWRVISNTHQIGAEKVGLIICDMWDDHTCPAAAARVDEMAPRMNVVVKAARSKGVQIVHAPSGTMGFYKDSPARIRMMEAVHVDPPAEIRHVDPVQPIDASDPCDSLGKKDKKPWTRQNEGLEIDESVDGISDEGQEVYNLVRQRGITELIIMGVHTGMCILDRTFAIKQMVRWGVKIALIRDMTDALYNPAKPPYVSHDEGTRLVIEYIEKFWCPTILSKDLLD